MYVNLMVKYASRMIKKAQEPVSPTVDPRTFQRPTPTMSTMQPAGMYGVSAGKLPQPQQPPMQSAKKVQPAPSTSSYWQKVQTNPEVKNFMQERGMRTTGPMLGEPLDFKYYMNSTRKPVSPVIDQKSGQPIPGTDYEPDNQAAMKKVWEEHGPMQGVERQNNAYFDARLRHGYENWRKAIGDNVGNYPADSFAREHTPEENAIVRAGEFDENLRDAVEYNNKRVPNGQPQSNWNYTQDDVDAVRFGQAQQIMKEIAGRNTNQWQTGMDWLMNAGRTNQNSFEQTGDTPDVENAEEVEKAYGQTPQNMTQEQQYRLMMHAPFMGSTGNAARFRGWA